MRDPSIRGSLPRVLPALVPLLIAGQGVGLRVEATRGISSKDAGRVVTQLSEAIQTRSRQTVVRDQKRGACRKACLAGVRKRTGAQDVVLLRLIGVPTRIRMTAERVGKGTQRAEVDLPRSGSWESVLTGVALQLFPEAPPPPAVVPPPPPPPEIVAPAPPPKKERSILPIVALGVSGAALAVGAGFGWSSRSARRSVANEPHSDDEIDRLESRTLSHGLAANILFGTAAVAAATGVVLLLVDD